MHGMIGLRAGIVSIQQRLITFRSDTLEQKRHRNSDSEGEAKERKVNGLKMSHIFIMVCV